MSTDEFDEYMDDDPLAGARMLVIAILIGLAVWAAVFGLWKAFA